MTDPNSIPSHADRLTEIEERVFYELGPMFGSLPSLFRAKLPPGKAAHASLLALLDHIEARDSHAKEVRAILAACQTGTTCAITPGAALFGMPPGLLAHVMRIFCWVAATGGLSLDDFEDGGARFLRVVLRKRPKSVAAPGAGARPCG